MIKSVNGKIKISPEHVVTITCPACGNKFTGFYKDASTWKNEHRAHIKIGKFEIVG